MRAVKSLLIVAAAGGLAAWALWGSLSVVQVIVVAAVSLGLAVLLGLVLLILQFETLLERLRTWFGDVAVLSAVCATVLVVAFLAALGSADRDPGDGSLPVSFNLPVAYDRYVALGDSYAAGEGLAPYLPGTQDEADGGNRCHRSSAAYAKLLRSPGDQPLDLRFPACSGAVAADVFDAAQRIGQGPQVPRGTVDAEVDLVTLTIGGNDAHFADLLQHCARKAGCMSARFRPSNLKPNEGESDTPRSLPLGEWADRMLPKIEARVSDVLAKARTAFPQARIVLLGYPYLLPIDAPAQQGRICPALLRSIDRKERDALRTLQRELNGRLFAAAKARRVDFVDPNAAWVGHQACGAAADWINPLIGRSFTIGPGSFHPTATGQAAFASLVSCYLAQYPDGPPPDAEDAPGAPGHPLTCTPSG